MEFLNMYRIVKLRKISLQSACARIYGDHSSLVLQRTCSLCNRSSSKLLPVYTHHVKEYSTSLIPDVHHAGVKKKKGPKIKRNVSDLLVVNNDTVLESRAKIMKLSARELSLFVERADLEPHQVKDKACNQKGQTSSSHISTSPSSLNPTVSSLFQSHDASKLPDQSNVQNFNDEGKSSATNSETRCDENSVDKTCNTPPPKKKTKKKRGDDEKEEERAAKMLKWKEFVARREAQKLQSRQMRTLWTLVSYLDVCVSNGQLKEAYSSLHHYCKKHHTSFVSPVSAFEIVLKGCALDGKLDTVKALLDMMHSYQIPLSLVCYAACLECLGRCKESDQLELVQSLVEDMHENGFKKEDLLSMGSYTHDSKNIILKTIRLIDPGYSVDPSPPDMDYELKLLNGLNDLKLANEGRYQSPATGILTTESVDSLVGKQLEAENAGAVTVRNINCSLDSEDEAQTLAHQTQIEKDWRKAIQEGLKRDLKLHHSKRKQCKKTNFLHAFLTSVPQEDLVDMILMEIKLRINDSEMFSTQTCYLYSALGLKVNRRYVLLRMIHSGQFDKTTSVYKQFCHWYFDPSKFPSGPDNARKIWQTLEYQNPHGSDIKDVKSPWPDHILQDVGKFLYKTIFRDVMIDMNHNKPSQKPRMIPAFYTIYRHVGVAHQEQLKIHPLVNKIYQPRGQAHLIMDTAVLPMFSPPKPWVSPESGGFLLTKTTLVRMPPLYELKSKGTLTNLVNSAPIKQIYGPLDALNQLGSIPWRVNCKVLDVMTQVFNSGGSADLNIPSSSSTACVDVSVSEEMTDKERKELFKMRKKLRRESAGMYSQWCDVLYKLCLANHFRDKIFWLPHNMDFRGRVYPIAPHLHHMGSDIPRSLLIFAKGEKLGPKGLDWLKIHLVNLTGMKKQATLEERLNFANKMLPQIMESADDPLGLSQPGKKWWTKSEEVWQTLAACIEITSAIRSGDPENYISHYPVHQDGSCNGLQHYAALGRDIEGAMSVNLSPSEKPADVYSCVLDLVEKKRAEDAKRGDALAQQLAGFMCRKLVKQTVMTTVYGVTRYGAILQISGNLQDMGFPEKDVTRAASYLTQLTFDSITTMFTSTKKIQDWFTQVANFLSQKMGESVMWVTPIGLPVIQPYYKLNKVADSEEQPPRNFFNNNNFGRIVIANPKKQKNGFPPNFIHSLDSSHMMLTALYCEQANVTFASVHDCFWTHASNVETMSKICREQFVKLHSEPILEDLSASFQHQYNKYFEEHGHFTGKLREEFQHLVNQVPQKGTFNLSDVLQSKYFFS